MKCVVVVACGLADEPQEHLGGKTPLEAARTPILDQMAARDFEEIPKDIGYVNALAHLGIAAAELGDRIRAERLYGLLLPYALYNTPNSMLFYDGSASHSLALMAGLPILTWIRFLLWLLAGLAIYFIYGIRRSRLR